MTTWKTIDDTVGNTPLVRLKRLPGETTNVVLWPRPLVLFTSRQTLARLTPAQRGALRAAAAADLGPETKVLSSFERNVTQADCALGRLRFVAGMARQSPRGASGRRNAPEVAFRDEDDRVAVKGRLAVVAEG